MPPHKLFTQGVVSADENIHKLSPFGGKALLQGIQFKGLVFGFCWLVGFFLFLLEECGFFVCVVVVLGVVCGFFWVLFVWFYLFVVLFLWGRQWKEGQGERKKNTRARRQRVFWPCCR